VAIFNDTIAVNVAYGSEYDEARIEKVLGMAGALEFVQSFPDGIHTLLEEFGTNLSGGQRQRIALARALYKDASVLILDEATSALDNESEASILRTLERISHNKIIISIAHRLQTVEKFDIIYLFKKGKIVDSGTHEALLQKNDYYKALYEKSLKE